MTYSENYLERLRHEKDVWRKKADMLPAERNGPHDPTYRMSVSAANRYAVARHMMNLMEEDYEQGGTTMKKLNVYHVYLDDTKGGALKVTVPAPTPKDAKAYCSGNGEPVAVTLADLQDINLDCLAKTLRLNAWGAQEIAVITRALEFCGLARR